MNSLLTRFWFKMESGYGVGVTAYSVEDARTLIANELTLSNADINGVVEDVDIETLDNGHVIPNMGPPNIRGIWFPNLNS